LRGWIGWSIVPGVAVLCWRWAVRDARRSGEGWVEVGIRDGGDRAGQPSLTSSIPPPAITGLPLFGISAFYLLRMPTP